MKLSAPNCGQHKTQAIIVEVNFSGHTTKHHKTIQIIHAIMKGNRSFL